MRSQFTTIIVHHIMAQHIKDNTFSKPSPLKSAKLRKLADSLQKQIDAKLDPAIGRQRPTARRARITDGIQEEGRKLLKIQTWLYAIAFATDNNILPPVLMNVNSKRSLELLFNLSNTTSRHWRGEEVNDTWMKEQVWGSITCYTDWREDLCKAGITGYEEAKAAIAALNSLPSNFSTTASVSDIDLKIQALERTLVYAKISGYFPTPKEVVEIMLKLIDIKPSMSVLEPHAGNGVIADVIRSTYNISPDVIELNNSLREILTLKGYNIKGCDFLKFEGQKYDRIIMNPPWGKEFGSLHDTEHIRHAYSLLNDQGCLISVASASCTFQSNKKAIEFRSWLASANGTLAALPSESFKNSGTNTSCYIVRINKTEKQENWESVEPDWKLVEFKKKQQEVEILVKAITDLTEGELATMRSRLPGSLQYFSLDWLVKAWTNWVKDGNTTDHVMVSWDLFVKSLVEVDVKAVKQVLPPYLEDTKDKSMNHVLSEVEAAITDLLSLLQA